MVRLIALFALLASPPHNYGGQFTHTLTGKVVRSTDGDTISVLDAQNRQHKIRLFGIDAPELLHQAFGQRAQQALGDLVAGQQVKVLYRERDGYGRILAHVMLGNRWVDCEMVADGFAWHYRHYSKNRELEQAEQSAKASSAGLWKEPRPVPRVRQAGEDAD